MMRGLTATDFPSHVSKSRRGAPRLGFVLVFAALAGVSACAPPRPDHPVIGAKNFTEQVILGELLAQEIEAHSQLKVERRFYLAGSYICHQALVAGRIDAYVEYTGTASTAILKQPLERDPDAVFKSVRALYASRNGALADVLRFTRRREQSLGKKRGCSRGVYFAQEVRA